MSSGKSGRGSEMWYLRKTDGSEYGPATLDEIARWAAESRVVSGNAVSRDRREWVPVEDVPELGMEWTAHLADGRKYGPFNILATRDLHLHKVLPADARLTHRTDGEETTVSEWLARQSAASGEATVGGDSEPAQDGSPEAAAAVAKKRRRSRRSRDDGQRNLWDPGVDVDVDVDAAAAGSARDDDERADETAMDANGDAAEDEETDEGGGTGSDADIAADEVVGTAEEDAAANTIVPDDEPAESEDGEVPAEALDAGELEEPPEEEPEEGLDGAVDDGTEEEEAEVEPEGEREEAEPVITDVQTADEADGLGVDENGVSPEAEAAREAKEEVAEAALREADALRDRLAALDKLQAATAKQLKGAEGARAKAEAEIARLCAEAETAAETHRQALAGAQAQADAADERARQAEVARGDTEAANGQLAAQVQDFEQRLQAAVDELKTAHADEARATAALRGAEAANQRKTQVYEKRIKDLLDERNALTRLVEKQTARLKLLNVAALACLGVAALSAVFGVALQLRGCARQGGPADGPSVRAAATAAGHTATPPAAAAKRPALPIISTAPGTRVAYDRTGCVVYFDAGVFSAGTTITPAATVALQRLAPQLKTYLADYDLVVEGYTDNQPVTRDSRYGSNADLAMARARAFARVLSADFGIPLASMRAVGGDVARAPYPNDSELSRARNRTVVLRLVRHAGD